jgi:predicted metal-dependent TIM-barrel fold hydrolase
MTSRTTDDYVAMAAAGISALVEPAFWLGQPRTTVGSFVDYFNSLVGWERFRASQFGIRHFCTIGLNPKEANNPKLAGEVIDLLPRFLAKDGVVAVGELGFDDQTDDERGGSPANSDRTRLQPAGAGAHLHRDKKQARSAPSNCSAR